MPPQKRARGGDGVLKTARSTTRTRHKPVARIPISRINDKPKEAGRGAERLATPNAQGIYHQPLLGPSFQQGRAEQTLNGEPIWVEGRVGAEVMHHISSTVQQQQQEQEEEMVEFKIPRKFKTMHKALLVATEVDLARGVVQALKCRLCPNTTLKTWEDFKRHCDTAEKHPLDIWYCERCGDFFARKDALVRHGKKPPRECAGVKSEEAATKRRETKRAHDEYIGRLKECLKTDEDIGVNFSQIIKEMYPDSSKKRMGGSEEQSRLKGR
ncbi:hypothetical protein DFH94DRAFT_91151 [Russula ochroleuca]|uniref:Uncharacterized protein n=1 Tax=Russula ochroleuca TaxID=152965 RepID=A0A9P5MSP2_9AGAM|nr:hypothetical protein DFH94DRAFT_91151 [Russula ochroleuca]